MEDDNISDISSSDKEDDYKEGVEVRAQDHFSKTGGSSSPEKKRGFCLPLLISVCIVIAALVGFLIWYFVTEDDAQPIASCGDCHCILKDNTTACPERPQVEISDSVISSLAAQRLLNNESFALDCNPYNEANCELPLDGGSFEEGEEAVCGVHYQDTECSEYQLKNYPDRATAEAAGAFVTHLGTCGFCSTMQDLSVYLANLDLTTISLECGKKLAVLGTSEGIECFQDLGMSLPCARMWSFNADNTKNECGLKCFASDVSNVAFNGPPPTCPLNECLQCDEENSGPVFQSYAGRTQRQSGLLSAIARPCDAIASIKQGACPETVSL